MTDSRRARPNTAHPVLFYIIKSVILAAALFATAAPSHADLLEATLVRVTSGSGMGASDASILTGVDYEYDSNTGAMTQVSASTRIVFSLDPFGSTRLFEHDFTGLSFDTAAGSVSATTYACIEGNFGAIVGAALCSNTVFGANFVNDTTTDYSTIPGTRFVGGDDIVAGPQQQLVEYASEFASWEDTTLIIETSSWTATPGVAGLQLEFLMSGPPPQLVNVPDVIGQPQGTAEIMIMAEGLFVGEISTALHYVIPAGSVISQSPEACLECALSASFVDLEVSLGPPMPGQAPALIDELIDTVEALDLKKGLSRSLIRKLENARRKLTEGNDTAGLNILQAFVNHVEAQSGKGISVSDAALLVAGAHAVSEAVLQTCDGFAATIVGTDDDDDIHGTNGIDVIVGLGGGDRISGHGGDDIVCGGDGNDDLLGGDGADRLLGDFGNDVLEGHAGDDVCDGVSGVDSASLDCEVRENVDTEVIPVTLFADDGVQLDGALYVPTDDALKPGGKYRKLAMIVSHGAMGSFDSSMPKIMGLQAAPLGFTVLALNRRDWGPTGGGGDVLFEDATLDLGVGIRLLNEMGFEAIYVAGHSQGTNNAAIYPSFSLDPTVAGVGLYGTVDDGRDTARNLLFNPDNVSPGYPELVLKAELLVSMGKGDDVIQWDTAFGQPLFRSPANFLSYWGPDSLSVVEREITKLSVPALLMRAEGDQFTPDEMSQNVLNAALAADVDAVYEILDYPYDPGNFGGNAHGFVRVEREMMATTLQWLVDRVPQASQYTKDIQVPAP